MAVSDDPHWAVIQMLEHWKRCGCSQISVGDESTSIDWPIAGSKPPPPATQSHNLPVPAKPPLPSIPIRGTTPVNSVALDTKGSPGTSTTNRWSADNEPNERRIEKLEALQKEVQTCVRCPELACNRKQTVFGIGNPKPRVAFFGEAPGADEDRLGEPFVGAAGQLLNKILLASQLKREEVYILNSLKCRPPANRTPTDIEIENCRPYFESQLEILQPEFIVCLGAVAVRAILKSNQPVGRLRGRFHRFRGAQVLVTYHPAYLLRNEDAKRLTWGDMQLLMRAMGLKIPSK